MKKVKRIRHDAKGLFRLCLVNGLLDESRVRRVVESLRQNTRSDSLPLLIQFLQRIKFDANLHTATVESATPLTTEFQNKVRDGLTRRYGPGFPIDFHHSPKLIGGMRIKIGCDVYDGSVQARLADLEAKF
jgi:F-type H+-transporting ATPase subunit delta